MSFQPLKKLVQYYELVTTYARVPALF